MEARTLPYSPGRKLFPGFGNSAATRIAPVRTSTWTIGKGEFALVLMGYAVSENQLKVDLLQVRLPQFRRRESTREIDVLLFARREVNLYWIECRYRRDRAACRTD
jgi:hypothetical protein